MKGKKKNQGGGGGGKTLPSPTPTPTHASPRAPPPPSPPPHTPVTRSVSKAIQSEQGKKSQQLDETSRQEESKGGNNFRWEQHTKELAIKEGNAHVLRSI